MGKGGYHGGSTIIHAAPDYIREPAHHKKHPATAQRKSNKARGARKMRRSKLPNKRERPA